MGMLLKLGGTQGIGLHAEPRRPRDLGSTNTNPVAYILATCPPLGLL